MSALNVLEVVAIFGSIVGVWFALIGWKLVSSDRAQQHPRPERLRPNE